MCKNFKLVLDSCIILRMLQNSTLLLYHVIGTGVMEQEPDLDMNTNGSR